MRSNKLLFFLSALVLGVLTNCRPNPPPDITHDSVRYIESEHLFIAEYRDAHGDLKETIVDPASVYHSLLTDFPDATIESLSNDETAIRSAIHIGRSDSRDGIFAPPNTVICFPQVMIKPKTLLFISPGIANQDDDTLELSLLTFNSDTNQWDVLRSWNAKEDNLPEKGQWRDELIDLDEFKNRDVEFGLKTTTNKDDQSRSDEPYWSGLKLMTVVKPPSGIHHDD
jgi:hypothetical protein